MSSQPARSRRPARLVALAVGLFVLAQSGSGRQPGLAVAPPSAPLPVPGLVPGQPNGEATIPEYTLGECIAIAVERQPTLRAVRSSQAASGAGLQALDNIGRLGQLVAKDLPVRKEQAQRGAVAVAADVQKTHNEIVHDVTRLYYTAVYARQGAQIAEDVVAQVELLTKIGKDLLDKGVGNMTKAKLNVMEIGLEDARRLLRTAQLGERKAYGALREMMAVQDTSVRFKVKDRELPVMAANIPLNEELVVDLALCRRPELALAAAGADAFRLEVYAQSAVRFKKTVPTLAIGGDIKAREVPATVRDLAQQYKPGAIIPEMPPQLVGNQADRVARAMHYSQRADAVFEKARNLVRLEAENAYLEYELAAQNVIGGKRKFERGKNLMERVRELADNPNAEREQLVRGYIEAAKAQSDYVEAVWQYLLTLAHLERVTAGGVRPEFPGR